MGGMLRFYGHLGTGEGSRMVGLALRRDCLDKGGEGVRAVGGVVAVRVGSGHGRRSWWRDELAVKLGAGCGGGWVEPRRWRGAVLKAARRRRVRWLLKVGWARARDATLGD